VRFEVICGQSGPGNSSFPPACFLPQYLQDLGHANTNYSTRDTLQAFVKTKNSRRQNHCVCAHGLRVEFYMRLPQANGVTKIALGHHRDDLLGNLVFLNMFLRWQNSSRLAPLLRSDDGEYGLSEPLAYCSEKDLERFAELRDLSRHSLQLVAASQKKICNAK